jgi:hypothetical protein
MLHVKTQESVLRLSQIIVFVYKTIWHFVCKTLWCFFYQGQFSHIMICNTSSKHNFESFDK